MVLGPMCERVYGEAFNPHWEWIVDIPGQTGLRVAENDAEGYYLEPITP